jgi:glutamate-1-semialdehyde 2,1-aminomutase
LQQAADAAGVPVLTTRVGGMFGLFFTDAKKVINFAEAGNCDVAAFRAFFHLMLERGVYLAPSAFEAGFVSSAHTQEHIEATVARVIFPVVNARLTYRSFSPETGRASAVRPA